MLVFTVVRSVTGQFADKPACSQPSRRLVNLQTSQLSETSDLKFAIM